MLLSHYFEKLSWNSVLRSKHFPSNILQSEVIKIKIQINNK